MVIVRLNKLLASVRVRLVRWPIRDIRYSLAFQTFSMNKLHSDLKNSTTVNMFKKRYTTFLVSEYEATKFLAKIAIILTFVCGYNVLPFFTTIK